MERLIATSPAPTAEATNAAKLANAVHTFQLGRSTREQRKQAVRDLVDILEFHRPAVKQHLLSKDEDDLFNIANNFALRHHNQRQKDDYDDAWLTWLFYVYLATAHLMLGRVGGVDGFATTIAVTRAISGHATPAMQLHYSTAHGGEVKQALAKVAKIATGGGKIIDLATVRKRRRKVG
jgi:hypothetical protein